MDKNIPNTDFIPLKKPISFESKQYVEYKKYLDDFYSNEWMQNYFKTSEKEKDITHLNI